MAGGNFDQQLNIAGNGFVEWPTGPLVRADGETILRVEVWILQKYTQSVQMSYQDTFGANPSAWLADKAWYPKPWVGGSFVPGPALGIAVLVAMFPTAARNYYWWSEEVELIP